MEEHVYKTIEVTGSSKKSIEEAIERAIRRAGKTVRQMRWFQVSEMRGAIEGDQVAEHQVTLKIGFTLE